MATVKLCACGKPTKGRGKKCSKDCGRTKDTGKKQFIAVDGEGVDRPDGKHEYVMLSVGDQTLTNPDGSVLGYDQIFEFLWGEFQKHREATFIGFFLGYDFIMWTQGFNEHEGRQLYGKQEIENRKPKRRKNPEPFPVYVGNKWEVDIHAGKRFRLKKHEHTLWGYESGDHNYDNCRTCGSNIAEDKIGRVGKWCTWEDFWPKRKNRERMFICDTGSFWQATFMSVIDPKGWAHPIVSDEEYEVLKEGKAARGMVVEYGSIEGFEELKKYNLLENEVLVRVTEELNKGFLSAPLNLKVSNKDWYGPGRVAQMWLESLLGTKNFGEYEHDNLTRTTMENTIPDYVMEAARKTYYGGWFEQFIHGHIPGPVYEYDINSAYPYIISKLPCLLHGTWSQSDGNDSISERSLRILHIQTHGSNPYIGGLPYRTPKGNITHPQSLEGWYWEHEVHAAQRAGLIDHVEYVESIEYVPCPCDPPLADIELLYRMRIGADTLSDEERTQLKNSPLGKALKLIYNSAYGKFAQSIGMPKFGNALYASLITAGCRAMILDAIATHPCGAEAVTMVATDGVYFTSEHPELLCDPYKLGAWDVAVKHGMTQLMPGVYWDNKTREAVKNGTTLKLKSRGISAKDLARSIHSLDNSYVTFAKAIIQGDVDIPYPTMELNIDFRITSAKQAIQRNQWNTAGRVIHNDTRLIDANPRTKRQPEPYTDRGFIRTRPYDRHEPYCTTPYNKTFGWGENTTIPPEELGITQDGDLGTFFTQFIT